MEKPDQKASKFETEDMPKIIIAIQKARTAKTSNTLVLEFADNGGLISALHTFKERVK